MTQPTSPPKRRSRRNSDGERQKPHAMKSLCATELRIVVSSRGALELMADHPSSDSQARGDPYCTLFVGRLSFETSEQDLEREFTKFGPIERVLNLGW